MVRGFNYERQMDNGRKSEVGGPQASWMLPENKHRNHLIESRAIERRSPQNRIGGIEAAVSSARVIAFWHIGQSG